MKIDFLDDDLPTYENYRHRKKELMPFPIKKKRKKKHEGEDFRSLRGKNSKNN